MCSAASVSITLVLPEPALVDAPTEAKEDQVRGMVGCLGLGSVNTTEVWGGCWRKVNTVCYVQ